MTEGRHMCAAVVSRQIPWQINECAHTECTVAVVRLKKLINGTTKTKMYNRIIEVGVSKTKKSLRGSKSEKHRIQRMRSSGVHGFIGAFPSWLLTQLHKNHDPSLSAMFGDKVGQSISRERDTQLQSQDFSAQGAGGAGTEAKDGAGSDSDISAYDRQLVYFEIYLLQQHFWIEVQLLGFQFEFVLICISVTGLEVVKPKPY
ncbi:hypothetical protein K440DRAFT_661586 [Wilcoxina mikolae CBS 423.85]|nr:hypothetical protein K440DRAFT_661586 [Wilcoxina mikolae CBS 423.85]